MVWAIAGKCATQHKWIMILWACFQTTTRTDTSSKRHDVLHIKRRQHRPPTEQEMEEHRPPMNHTDRGAPTASRAVVEELRTEKREQMKERALFLRNVVGGNNVPVIVMKEYDTRLLAALVVPAKGADLEWSVDAACP